MAYGEYTKTENKEISDAVAHLRALFTSRVSKVPFKELEADIAKAFKQETKRVRDALLIRAWYDGFNTRNRVAHLIAKLVNVSEWRAYLCGAAMSLESDIIPSGDLAKTIHRCQRAILAHTAMVDRARMAQ